MPAREPHFLSQGGLAIALAAILGGCLLPQPDTPPIGPASAQGPAARPPVARATEAPTADNASQPKASGAPSPEATMAAGSALAPSSAPSAAAVASAAPSAGPPSHDAAKPQRVWGTVTGTKASRVVAIAADGVEHPATPDEEGVFSLDLVPGPYRIQIEVGTAKIDAGLVDVPADWLREIDLDVVVAGDPPKAAAKLSTQP